MANYIAAADGNLSDATGTWAADDATARNVTGATAANTALTSSYQNSSAFTPGAITIDGIAVYLFSRAASPAGTITVRLGNAGVDVVGTVVTINISDLPASANNSQPGWIFFKFAAPVLLIAATAYTVGLKTSSASQVNAYSTSGTNWARMLRTTTTGNPGAGDTWYILGEWTAAGTMTARTIAMDETAAVDYGSNTVGDANCCSVCVGGTLTYGVAGGTNYVLRMSCHFQLHAGGTLNIGTSGTPIPRNSTAVFEFDPASADGDFAFFVKGTLNVYGLSRTSGKNVSQCMLTADVAAAGTSISVDTDTGWLNGDEIALSATSRTGSEAESKALGADAGASSMTVAALTSAHKGTDANIAAKIILLTRNVQIRSTSTTLMASFAMFDNCAVHVEWCLFRYLGGTSTNRRGIESSIIAGSASFTHCVIRDCDNYGVYVVGTTTTGTIAFTDFSAHRLALSSGDGITVSGSALTTGTITLTRVVNIRTGNGGVGVYLVSLTAGVIVNTLWSNSCVNTGITIDHFATTAIDWTDIHSHSNGSQGILINSFRAVRIDGIYVWRNNDRGIYLVYGGRLLLKNGKIFGTTTSNIYQQASGAKITLRNVLVAGDSSFGTASGFELISQANWRIDLTLENCTFGVVSGIFRGHTTSDINFGTNLWQGEVHINNTILDSTTEFTNRSNCAAGAFVSRHRKDQVSNVHQREYLTGMVSYETTTFRTAAPSEKLTLNGAASYAAPLCSSVRRVPVNSGETVSIQAYVRKDSSYAGAQPRLMVLANPSLGIDDDTIINTMTVGADTWEALTGTTASAEEDGVLEFVVEAYGAAGAAYVDDWKRL